MIVRGTGTRADLRAAVAAMHATLVRTSPVRALQVWRKGEHRTLAIRKAPKLPDYHEAMTLSIMAAQLPDLCAARIRKPR